MIKPVEMQKLMIIGTRNAESRIVSNLHEAGVLEIRSLDIPALQKGKPLEIHEHVAWELVRMRGLISVFSAFSFSQKANGIKAPEKVEYSGTLAEASSLKIDKELKALMDERASLIQQESDAVKQHKKLTWLACLEDDVDFSRLETRTFTYAAGFMDGKAVSGFENEMMEYLESNGRVLSCRKMKKEVPVVIFYPKSENIEFMLSRYNFRRMGIPPGITTAKSGITMFEFRIAELRLKISEVEGKIRGLFNFNYARLARLEKSLSILAERSAISVKFSSGRDVFVLDGWSRKRDVPALKSMLFQDFPNEAEMIEVEGNPDEAPIALDNPKIASQFQFLVEFYALPKYYEFDPTFLLMLTVPLIYGMIVGDVGYGLVSIFLSLLILKKYAGGLLGNVAKIWLFSSFSAIIFGLVFDEWFGLTHVEFFEWLGSWGLHLGITHSLYTGLSRSHNLSLVIGLTLLVGVAQLSLGYILGILNAWNHDRKHAYARFAWLCLLLSGTTVVASLMFNLVPAEIGNIAIGIAAVCILVIGYLEGITGLFEIPGLAANTFSYARIAAAGVAGVVLAEIINESFLPKPGEGFLLFPVFIILHILNGGLAMFESIVQGGRLNLVEFYSKFFEGGGSEFRPFSIEEGKKEGN